MGSNVVETGLGEGKGGAWTTVSDVSKEGGAVEEAATEEASPAADGAGGRGGSASILGGLQRGKKRREGSKERGKGWKV